MVEIFQLQTATPPPALVEALSVDLWSMCRMPHIPIRLVECEAARGRCPPLDQTEYGEVWISPSTIAERGPIFLRVLYLHESAHRLVGAVGHDARFAALYLVLLRRASLSEEFRLYDLTDECRKDEAFGWVWRLSVVLAATELSAEDCVSEINVRYATREIQIHEQAVELMRLKREASELVDIKSMAWPMYCFAALVGALFVRLVF